MSEEVRTKQCQLEECDNYIADGHTLCDFHLLAKYNLLDKVVCDTADKWCEYDLLPVDTVLQALRRAENA